MNDFTMEDFTEEELEEMRIIEVVDSEENLCTLGTVRECICCGATFSVPADIAQIDFTDLCEECDDDC